jgi:hypothetical protein
MVMASRVSVISHFVRALRQPSPGLLFAGPTVLSFTTEWQIPEKNRKHYSSKHSVVRQHRSHAKAALTFYDLESSSIEAIVEFAEPVSKRSMFVWPETTPEDLCYFSEDGANSFIRARHFWRGQRNKGQWLRARLDVNIAKCFQDPRQFRTRLDDEFVEDCDPFSNFFLSPNVESQHHRRPIFAFLLEQV